MERVKPMLIAHRGDPAHAPENTIVSFRSAVARGAKAVEMDVRRCGDGSWIVFHDRFSRRPAHARGSPDPPPTLSKAISWCRARKVPVFLDVKETDGEARLLRILRESGWLRSIRILAGQPRSLRRWRRILPAGHPLYWVTGFRARLTPERIRTARRLKLTGLAAYKRWVDSGAVKRVHEAGLQLLVWTVRTAPELKAFARLGPDGIMSEVWNGRRV